VGWTIGAGSVAALALLIFAAGRWLEVPPRSALMVSSLDGGARVRLERIDRGLPRRGEWRNGFEVVDFDGDGRLDLVHGPPRRAPGSPPFVFLGDGHGGFTALARSFPALAYEYGDVAVADFDGDGALDLALAAHDAGLVVLARRGADFVPWGPPLGVVGPSWLGRFTSRALAAGDWNGDGRADLVTLSEGAPAPRGARRGEGPRVLLLTADAAQILAPASPVDEFGDDVEVGDVDGDGHPEILAATGTLGSKRVLYRGGDRGLVPVAVDALPEHASVRAVAIERGARPAFFVAGLDHGAARPAAFVERVAWDGARFVGQMIYRGEGAPEPRALAAADFDGDGAPDLVVGHADGVLRLFLGPALEPAAVLRPEDWRVGCSAYHVEAADVVPEGGAEIVVSFAGTPAPGRCPSGGGLAVYRARSRR
jgi:hypothetical protein